MPSVEIEIKGFTIATLAWHGEKERACSRHVTSRVWRAGTISPVVREKEGVQCAQLREWLEVNFNAPPFPTILQIDRVRACMHGHWLEDLDNISLLFQLHPKYANVCYCKYLARSAAQRSNAAAVGEQKSPAVDART